jgi:hypothetical protein
MGLEGRRLALLAPVLTYVEGDLMESFMVAAQCNGPLDARNTFQLADCGRLLPSSNKDNARKNV